jgi:hypothetical protein
MGRSRHAPDETTLEAINFHLFCRLARATPFFGAPAPAQLKFSASR